MDKLGGQKSVDKFGGRDAEKKYVIFLNLRLKLFFIDLAGPGDPGGPGAVYRSRGSRRSGRPRGRFRSRSGNRPRDHHNRHLRALELRMHQTSPQKNEIEAVLWTIEFSSLHSPARLQLASLAGPNSARFTRGLARLRPRNHHKWTLHALELRMHQTSPQNNEIEAILWRN